MKIYDVEDECEVVSFPYVGIDDAFWSPQEDVIAIIEEDADLYFLDIEQVFGKPYDQLECPYEKSESNSNSFKNYIVSFDFLAKTDFCLTGRF